MLWSCGPFDRDSAELWSPATSHPSPVLTASPSSKTAILQPSGEFRQSGEFFHENHLTISGPSDVSPLRCVVGFKSPDFGAKEEDTSAPSFAALSVQVTIDRERVRASTRGTTQGLRRLTSKAARQRSRHKSDLARGECRVFSGPYSSMAQLAFLCFQYSTTIPLFSSSPCPPPRSSSSRCLRSSLRRRTLRSSPGAGIRRRSPCLRTPPPSTSLRSLRSP